MYLYRVESLVVELVVVLATRNNTQLTTCIYRLLLYSTRLLVYSQYDVDRYNKRRGLDGGRRVFFFVFV